MTRSAWAVSLELFSPCIASTSGTNTQPVAMMFDQLLQRSGQRQASTQPLQDLKRKRRSLDINAFCFITIVVIKNRHQISQCDQIDKQLSGFR